MQAVFSNLMAGLLLIQALTGWCDRSPHACASRCPDATDLVQAEDGCCRHDACPVGEDRSPADSCPSKGECHGICTYVPSQETRIDTSQVVLPDSFMAVMSATLDAEIASSLLLDALWHSAISEPPIRLHLLHQIILI
jgi:hypothetical protein